MWNYEKRLEYPVNITTPNPKIAQIIMSQYGGPDGEMGASMRYLSQRFTAPNRIVAGVLNDVVQRGSFRQILQFHQAFDKFILLEPALSVSGRPEPSPVFFFPGFLLSDMFF